MQINDVTILSNQKIAENTFVLEVEYQNGNDTLKPGQFFNIQVEESIFPLLRRPFSISSYDGISIKFMFKVVGEGTRILSQKVKGEKINLLGPLGNSFVISNSYDHYFLIGGGIGIAPFPFLINSFLQNQTFEVLFGVRSKNEVHEYGLKNISYSSDDGSIGFHGNVIQLLENKLQNIKKKKVKIFACGPNAMTRALKKYAMEKNIDCEISMESAMACGFGICQGCPIQFKDSDTYKLICKDGPIFNIRDIEI